VVFLGGMVFDFSIKDFDLSIGPRVSELREFMLDPLLFACLIENMDFIFRP